MSNQLTEQEIAEYKEAFSLLDKDGDGVISITMLPLLVRSLYMFPTEAELADMINEVDPNRKGKLEFSEFLSLIVKRAPDPDPEEELMEAFESLSENKDLQLIAINQIRHNLTQQGERLTEGEFNDFLEFISGSNLKVGNEFKYKDLAKLLIHGYTN